MSVSILLLLIILLIFYKQYNNSSIFIYIGNSFNNFYHLPVNPIKCSRNRIIYKCQYSQNKMKRYHASIYNGNRKFPSCPNLSYNIVITTEKLSQVKFMKEIGEGKYRNYHLAVDYRLFISKYHLSRNIYSYFNMTKFIQSAKKSFINLSSFMKRKNFVYIQKVHYKKRQYFVKEMMKYFDIDSYGRDLNNKKWPKDVSNKIELLKKYKFCIAIENSVITWKNGSKFEADIINDDYVTEKLTDCFLAGCIPIYFGPKNIQLFLPHPYSIINFSSFNSINDLIKYLTKINANASLLMKHLEWYHNRVSKEWFRRFDIIYTFDYCKICNKVKSYV